MKRIVLSILLLLPLLSYGQDPVPEANYAPTPKKILTGFSGGMTLHIGYAFSSNPIEMFRLLNAEGNEYIKSLPKDGVNFGLGGQLRLHLVDHIHLGGEGYVSMMPLAGQSSIRTGWGGLFADGYLTIGRVRPLLGLGIGGGSMNRLFVPASLEEVAHWSDSLAVNASFTKTGFFYLDPYVGLEILLGAKKNKALLIRIDYQLPFDHGFVTPSGPRLYIGLMFGKQKNS